MEYESETFVALFERKPNRELKIKPTLQRNLVRIAYKTIKICALLLLGFCLFALLPLYFKQNTKAVLPHTPASTPTISRVNGTNSTDLSTIAPTLTIPRVNGSNSTDSVWNPVP